MHSDSLDVMDIIPKEHFRCLLYMKNEWGFILALFRYVSIRLSRANPICYKVSLLDALQRNDVPLPPGHVIEEAIPHAMSILRPLRPLKPTIQSKYQTLTTSKRPLVVKNAISRAIQQDDDDDDGTAPEMWLFYLIREDLDKVEQSLVTAQNEIRAFLVPVRGLMMNLAEKRNEIESRYYNAHLTGESVHGLQLDLHRAGLGMMMYDDLLENFQNVNRHLQYARIFMEEVDGMLQNSTRRALARLSTEC